jgi:2-C-methyl-D-erythritol 2,4-cyclodiphosphate synthase
LKQAWNLVVGRGYVLGNVDVTVITEQPRIAPMAEAMRRALAGVLDAEIDLVSIKATRGEGLGPEGRGECITVLAVALLEGK